MDPFFFIPQIGSTNTNSHKRAGLTHKKFIGVQVAFLAKKYKGLTSKEGTKIILQTKPI